MEQAVAERPFSQEQHAGQLHSWHNETDDSGGTNLQNSSQSQDPRRWTVGDQNHMSNSNIDGKDIRVNRDFSSVCRDNLRGKCSRGSVCRFQHADRDGVGFDKGGQWNLGPTSEPGYSQSFGGNKDGDSYRRSPCRKFQWGNCNRGSSCPYLHAQSAEFSSTGVDNSSKMPFYRESRERLPCRSFQNGRCTWGSSCSYLHSEFSESDRPMHKLNAGQQHRIVTASRNFGFHEGSVNNTFNASQVHGVANKENNSRSFSREPRRRSPCRNYLNGRCHLGPSCSRLHPDNAHGHNWSAENSNNHNSPGGHRYNNLNTVPRNRSPCHFIHRGNSYQGTPSANLHPATVYERTRYDLGARNQVTATSRDLNFNRGNVVREVNNQGMQPYVNTHPGYNRETVNGFWRGSSSERKRSRPVSDIGEDHVQPEVCLRFTKGRCDQGGNCRYLHSFHEYASSITQPNQTPHLETTAGVMSVDQANQCAEGNDNVNSRYQPFKRPRTWSGSSFSPEGNVRNRMLRRDYSMGDYHRSRSHHESQNQHPDYRPFKYYRPENHSNNGQHLKIAATSVTPRQITDFIPMATSGQGELMSHRMHLDQCQSGRPRLEAATGINQAPIESERCETAGIKVDLNHETNEKSEETEHMMKTYSGKMGHNQHSNSYECGMEVATQDMTHPKPQSLSINSSMGGTSLDCKSVVPCSVISEDTNASFPKTGDIRDVLVSDHPVEEQGSGTLTMKVQSTMVDLSSADTRDGLLVVSDNSILPASLSSDATILSSRRKLLVLDVNGLLADIVGDFPDRYEPDTFVGGKGVFKRPFCDNFLDFCFEKFDVGIWSSRTEKNVTRVLDCLMKNTKDKLLFCWHQSHCTQTGYKTVENNAKPLVLKELKKLWEKEEKDLPWKKGFYNQTNTILLDDSPYKALRNPPHTAIFPFPYSFRTVGDKSLGPEGDLRLYLERLAEADNVQNFIEENPFGQRPITKTNLSWAFYSKIAGDYASPQEPVVRTSSGPSQVNDVSQILLSLNAPAQPLG